MHKIIKLILLTLLILAVLLNLNWLKSSIAGVILGLLYFIIFGYLLAKIIFSAKGGSASGGKDKELNWQIIIGIFSLLSAYSLLGAIIYYFYQLNQLSVSILFAVISVAILSLDFKTSHNSEFIIHNLISNFPKLKSYILNLQSSILTITYLILFAIAIYTLFISQTADAIRSPWQIIPRAFFIIYFLATLNLIFLLFKSKTTSSNLILISLHFFLTTSVAFIIYKPGYGFDPFIHQATELAIFKNGFILPKPFYYLGQYSIVVIFAHLFQISTEWLDKLLLPILMAIFLPYIIYKSLARTFNWQKNRSQILSLIFLILPFSLFIATTPQALASLFAIIILFLSFLYLKDREIPFWFLAFLAACTLAIHALSGIPILIYLVIAWLLKNKNSSNKIILIIFALLSVFALPLALLLNSIISIYKITLTTPNFLIQLPNIFSKQFWFFLDLAYLYKNSIYLIFLIITSLALYNLIKYSKARLFIASLLTFAILIINSILLSFINVSFIINYEQGDFASRIFQLSFYFLLPIVIYGLYVFLAKAEEKKSIYQLYSIFLLSIFLTCSLYLSYPRFDDYDNSKFINVSQPDFDTVNFIEANSHGQNYIVLSNQMASAAALKIFGFTKYYNGQYFYPIPTGGLLYKYFETMIYREASKRTMEQSMEFARVNIAYFILPTYWSHFEEISAFAAKEADAIYNVDDKIWVFKYTK